MATTRRDPAIDIIRGLCIVSMVIGHLAADSRLYWLTHSQRWVNGAVGFVLLAGLVIGMVQRRAVRTSDAMTKLARRGRLVWAAHVGLVLLALVLAPWGRMSRAATPPADQVDGWGSALWQTVTLQLNPVDIDILSLYVVLFVVAAAGVLLLRHRAALALAALSVWIYVAGLADTSWAHLPRYANGPGSHFNIATWQLVFVTGLLIGWYWRDPRVARVISDRRVAVAAGGVVLAAFVAAQLAPDAASPGGAWAVVFGNADLGPGRIVLGWCMFLVLYHLLRAPLWRAPTRILALTVEPLGRRSLDSFVILSLFSLLLPVVAPYEPAGWDGTRWALIALAVCWAWAGYRDLRGNRQAGPPPVVAAEPVAVRV
jgi:hypothetical protein